MNYRVFSVIIKVTLQRALSFSGGSVVKHLPANVGLVTGWGNALEKEMTTHSSILAWEIPWTEEPGGLQRPQGCKELETT